MAQLTNKMLAELLSKLGFEPGNEEQLSLGTSRIELHAILAKQQGR